jgi:hypothetical protein
MGGRGRKFLVEEVVVVRIRMLKLLGGEVFSYR